MTEASTVYGRRIRKRREQLGWSQSDLAGAAAAAGCAVHWKAISRIELGQRQLHLDEAAALCAAMGMDLRTLAGPSDMPAPLAWNPHTPARSEDAQ